MKIDPAATRECDGYPALVPWAELEAWRNAPSGTASACPCGDPADCQECV